MPYHLFANIFTALSVLCGFVSIFSSMRGEINLAAWLIIVAIIMDILDGKTARLLVPTDDFGKEFDSLADIISFGMAPIVLLGTVYNLSDITGAGLSFLYILSAALRLARFNIQKTKANYSTFIGLPTTAAGGLIASGILFFTRNNYLPHLLHIKIAILLLALLMISNIRYPNTINIKYPISVTVFIAFLVLLVLYRTLSIWLVFVGYTIFGPVLNLKKSNREFLPG